MRRVSISIARALFYCAYIQFKNLDVASVQQFLQGKWKTIRQCGGVAGCQDIDDGIYGEYIGADLFRVVNDDFVSDYRIIEWKITERGCEIYQEGGNFDPLYPTILTSLVNRDTLYSFDERYGQPTSYTDIRLK